MGQVYFGKFYLSKRRLSVIWCKPTCPLRTNLVQWGQVSLHQQEKGRAPNWMHGPFAMNASDSSASYLLSSLGGLGLGSGLLDGSLCGSLGGLLGSLLGKLSSTLCLLYTSDAADEQRSV